MARTLDLSVLPTVTAPALITHVRRLVFAVQNAARVQRYAYLPTDVVWWARTLGASERQFFDNIKDAVTPAGYGGVVGAALGVYDNWDEANVNAQDFALRIKTRLYLLYARLSVLYLVRMGLTGHVYYERDNLCKLLCRRYEAYVDFVHIDVDVGQRKALIMMVLGHYLLYNMVSARSEGWVRNLKNVEEYLMRAESWARSGDALHSLAMHLDSESHTTVYTRMGRQQLEAALRRAYPRGEDMIADVLCYMLAETEAMTLLFKQRRYKLALLFREQMREMAGEPERLVEYFLNVRRLRDLVDAWSDRMANDPERVFDYAVRALAVLREIIEQNGTIYTCYAHLMERRHAQFAAPAQRAFVFPPPVPIPGIEETTPVSFLRNKTCLIRKDVLEDMPFEINVNDVLGAGSYGVVFGTTDTTRVVKVTDVFTEAEYAMQHAAGKAGFGPRTYSRHHLRNVVVVVNGTGIFENISFIVSERMSQTLESVIREERDFDRCVRIVDAVLSVVRRFNASNFTHHDLKPNNIMLAGEMHEADDAERWRLIDYGLAWYGGRAYDPLLLVKTEDSEPYGWNHRTSTVEDPREVYHGWIRSTPPGRIPSWDEFCLLFNLYVYVPLRSGFGFSKKRFREKIMERMQALIAAHPDNYDEMTVVNDVPTMHAKVRRDFCEYTRSYPLDDTPRTDPWRRRCPYKELTRKESGGVVRLFVPYNLLHAHGITIVDRLSATAYACCTTVTCDATVRFLNDGQDSMHDERTLRKLAKLGLVPNLLVSEMREMPRTLERERKVTTVARIRMLLLDRTGRTLGAVLGDLVDSAVTANVKSRIERLLDSAFRFVHGLARLTVVHHRMTTESLFYDEERDTFFLIDCTEVSRGATYDGAKDFTFGNGLSMMAPQYSLSGALLFVDVYNNFILNRVGGADRHIESDLASTMRRRIYRNYLQDFKGECEELTLHNDGRVSIGYAYTDIYGERRRVQL